MRIAMLFGMLVLAACRWCAPAMADPAPIQPVLQRALDAHARGVARPFVVAEGRSLLVPPSPGGVVLPVDDAGRWSCWVSFDPNTDAGRAFLPSEWDVPMLSSPEEALPHLPSAARETIARLEEQGVVWRGWIGATLEFQAPPEKIEALAELPGAIAVTAPVGPVHETFASELGGGCDGPPTVSEGLEEMRVAEFRALGYRGQGIRVGMLDLGFNGAGERIGIDLPREIQTRMFSSGDPGQAHGTACSEIVHDIAPDAELYLAGLGTAVDLQQALQWMKSNDVEVLSHSLAWFLGGGDGTGPIDELADAAARDGMIWVTSSGNFARSHWMGPYRDDDRDAMLELSGDREQVMLVRGGVPRLVLLWDRWPLSTDLAFEIEILDGEEVVARSDEDYANYPFAFRDVAAPHPLDDPSFRIRVRQGNPAGATVRVFRVDGGLIDPEDRVSSGSVTMPADSPSTIAVGAFSWRDQALEPFSSYGPTLGGLQKPELVGPDAICTSISQYAPFVGTSAACPHVAGAVALLLSAELEGGVDDVHWNQEQVRRLLSSSAGAIAAAPSPQSVGWGRVRLWVPGGQTNVAQLAPQGLGSSLSLILTGGGQTSAIASGRAAGPVWVLDAGGRRVAQIEPTRDGRTVQYQVRGAGLSRGRYWALEPVTGARGSFTWTEP